jgi:hypothetical protein
MLTWIVAALAGCSWIILRARIHKLQAEVQELRAERRADSIRFLDLDTRVSGNYNLIMGLFTSERSRSRSVAPWVKSSKTLPRGPTSFERVMKDEDESLGPLG